MPPIPRDMDELKARITEAVATIDWLNCTMHHILLITTSKIFLFIYICFSFLLPQPPQRTLYNYNALLMYTVILAISVSLKIWASAKLPKPFLGGATLSKTLFNLPK